MSNLFTNAISNLFSGRHSSFSHPTSKAGKRKKEDGHSGGETALDNSIGGFHCAAGSAAARRPGKSGDDAVHGAMTSALWAVARTPALVEAIERVGDTYDEVSDLSLILGQLRRTDDLREAAEAADVFLRANRPSIHDSMEPMDAIRGIVGLCGDSERVLEEAVTTTYKTTLKCTVEGCRFRRDDGLVKEEHLACRSSTVQLNMELRAACTRKDLFCESCNKKAVAKRYTLEKAAPCLVAAWPALVQVDSGQELLFVTTIRETTRFKLGVMIVKHRNKFVCMFREGLDYYRVDGKSVTPTTASDWKNAQPCLALFNLQKANSPRSRSPRGNGLPSFASNGGGQAGRKRPRRQIGYGQLSQGSGGSSSNSRARGAVAAAAAEVIEVDDDDSDRGDADTSLRGGAGASGESGATVANCSGGKGGRSSRGGKPEAEGQPPPPQPQALDVDDDSSVCCEEVLLADKPEPAESASTTPARRSRTVRDGGGGGAGSAPSPGATAALSRGEEGEEATGERDRRKGPGGFPRASSLSNGSPHDDSWMEQDGSPSEVGPCNNVADNAWKGSGSGGGGGGGGTPTLASGTASSARKRSRHLDSPERETPASLAGLTAGGSADSRMDVEDEDEDDDNDDVQLVESRRDNLRCGDEGGRRKRPPAPSSSSSAAAAATAVADGGGGGGSSTTVSDGLSGRRASDSSLRRESDGGTRGTASGGPLDSSPSTRLPKREVHEVDDDASPPSPPPAASSGKKHPSGAPMPFIGPRAPPTDPRPNGDGDTAFIGPARPPPSGPSALPPRPRRPLGQQQSSDAPWLTRNTHENDRRKAVAAARANRGPRSRAGGSNSGVGNGGGAAKDAGGQTTIPSSWEKTDASSGNASARSGGGGGGSSSSGKPVERRQAGTGSTFLGVGGYGGQGYRLRGDGGGSSGSGGSGQGRRLGGGEKVTEDLTGADDSWQWQDMEGVKGAGVGQGWPPGFVGGAGGDATVTTIRGINLQHDHLDRIVDSDGWLTSQIIDIRVKQLQELYPQHLYFDTSFFGFLCPSTERSGAFVVDYARVAGWTKSSRLPGEKSSLFDMQKLFIPINQGNVHWVLVVVDMNSGGSSPKVVSFFDSLGRNGTTYVEAVQQYLVSELSSRDKTRQDLFTPRPRPPANAPRQHNSSDCGVLMLHVMEELSTGPASGLKRLTQEEILSLRMQLVAKMFE